MAVQVESVDGAVERRILIGMITSKSVLGRVTSLWDGKLFRSRWSNALAALCVDFYKKHNEAPNKAIDSLYESWAVGQRDKATVDLLNNFLVSLDGDYRQLGKDVNPDHVIDIAGKHFREVKLTALKDDLETALAAHDLERGEKIAAAYRRVEMGNGTGVALFNDCEEVKAIFAEDNNEVLVRYPGALGEHFGDDLARDCFVVFEGTAKSTKSFWLQDVAWRGMCSRKKVAYFEAGDLSKHQVELRFMVRASGHPSRSTANKHPYWPCTVNVPSKMEVKEHATKHYRRAVITSHQQLDFEDKLDYDSAWAACKKVMNTHLKSKYPYFQLSVHANSTLTIDGIRTVLDAYAAQDWYPDILVVDYADIMAWPLGSKDERDAINTTWKQLRRLSQELHCLVVTATQADADGYDKEILTRKNFSGDRRKNDHISVMYGINMTDDEREAGVCRLNTVARRDGAFVGKRCVHVAQCLPLGRPAVLSSF